MNAPWSQDAYDHLVACKRDFEKAEADVDEYIERHNSVSSDKIRRPQLTLGFKYRNSIIYTKTKSWRYRRFAQILDKLDEAQENYCKAYCAYIGKRYAVAEQMSAFTLRRSKQAHFKLLWETKFQRPLI